MDTLKSKYYSKGLSPWSLRKQNPLAMWGCYAVILTVVMAVVAGQHLLDALALDRTGLVLFICVLFAVTATKSFFDALYVTRQMGDANRQIKDLWSQNSMKEFLEASTPSLFSQHVYNLHQIYRRDNDIHQDNLIELLQCRLHRRTNVVDLISNILVTLGLVGTIVGLLTAVGGLGLAVESVGGENQQLLAGMADTIGGMGTAFFTTLAGAILGGVVLRILGNVVESSSDLLVAQIAEMSEVYILPVLRNRAKARDIVPHRELMSHPRPGHSRPRWRCSLMTAVWSTWINTW